MTVRELAARLAALPEEAQDLQVFSTAEWSVVSDVEFPMSDYTLGKKPVVELSGYL